MLTRLFIIIVPILIPYLKFNCSETDINFYFGTPVTILSAGQTPTLLYENKTFSEIDEVHQNFNQVITKGFYPSTAIEMFLFTHSHNRNRHLIVAVSASQNLDTNLDLTISMKKIKSFCYTGYTDLGGYLAKNISEQWSGICDYLIEYKEYDIKKNDLQLFFSGISECYDGFCMYDFEGHHPNEETWLNQPTNPFMGIDYALKSKIDAWGHMNKSKKV